MARIYIDGVLYKETSNDNVIHGGWILTQWPEKKSKDVIITCPILLDSTLITCFFSVSHNANTNNMSLSCLAGMARSFVPNEIQLAEMLLT